MAAEPEGLDAAGLAPGRPSGWCEVSDLEAI